MKDTKTTKYAPKKPTKSRLKNIAIFYLARYSSSTENLRRILTKRAYSAAKFHDIDISKPNEWIDQIIEYFNKSGDLNDVHFSQTKIRSLTQKGKSPAAIKSYLLSKGVSYNTIDITMKELDESLESLELSAAYQYARRRRIGPYRQHPLSQETRKNEFRKLAMAGYSYKVANQIVHAESTHHSTKKGFSPE